MYIYARNNRKIERVLQDAACLNHGAWEKTVADEIGASLDENEAEQGLGEDVKDGVADGFGLRADGAGAFSKDPDDRVEEPGADGDGNGLIILTLEVGTIVELLTELPDEVHDGEKAEHGEAEESPLVVATAHEGADEAGDNHEDVHANEEVFFVGLGLGALENLPDHERGGDGPVNVASVVELAAIAAASGVTVAKSHGEVRETGNEADGERDRARQLDGVDELFLSERSLQEGVRSASSQIGVGGVVEGDIPEVESGDSEEGEGDPKDSSSAKLSTIQADGAFGARARRRSFRLIGFGLGFVALLGIVAALELAAIALSGLGSAVGDFAGVLRSRVMHWGGASAGSLVLKVRALRATAETDLYSWGKYMFLVHRSSLIASILGLVPSILGLVASILLCTVAGVLLCTLCGVSGVSLLLCLVGCRGEGKKGRDDRELHVCCWSTLQL